MKAIRLQDSSAPSALAEESVPQPQPGPGELLVRVYAAGLTPTELLWYPSLHRKNGEPRSGAIPGHEFSGVIAAIGPQAGDFEIGQEVYGMNDWFRDGAMAEYCITQPACIAPKPAGLTHVQAAAVPIAALTAWQGLFDRARLQPGERVLVHGGAGSVGLFAVQFARYRGAHAAATASRRNLTFVSQMGAEQVIDYQAERFEDQVADLDVVFDTVGGETLERSWRVLKPGGRMITIATGSETSTEERVKQAFFIVAPDAKELARIGDLLAAGRVQAVLDTLVPFDEAPRAYAGQVARHGRGKVVVAVAAEVMHRHAR